MDSTKRFSNRVENYRRYRPGYPPAVIELIRTTAQLAPEAKVADLGSGTGILTRLLLEAGWEVHAVEPNAPMREAAEADLGVFPRFCSLATPAETTGLPEASMDAITAAQAFHWFDREQAQREFRRVLKPEGWAFLIWNERKPGSPFDLGYHEILSSLGLTFEGVRNRADEKDLASFFQPGTYRETAFPNPQPLTWEELRGRFLSSSYVPTEEDSRHAGLLEDLRQIFLKNESSGKVTLEQGAWVYYGKV